MCAVRVFGEVQALSRLISVKPCGMLGFRNALQFKSACLIEQEEGSWSRGKGGRVLASVLVLYGAAGRTNSLASPLSFEREVYQATAMCRNVNRKDPMMGHHVGGTTYLMCVAVHMSTPSRARYILAEVNAIVFLFKSGKMEEVRPRIFYVDKG